MALVPVLLGLLVMLAPHATAAPAGVQTRQALTTLTLRVTGCEGCTIGVQRALSLPTSITPGKPTYWNKRKDAVVRDGRAVLVVPTAYTSGMSFTIAAPWAGSTNAVVNIVVQYSGKQPGDPVSSRFAAGSRVATSCWAGTTRSRLTLHVRVDRYAGRDFQGDRAVLSRPYFTPTLASVGAMKDAHEGTQGNQEAFYC